jgi:L-aspartate oxidase
VPESARQFDFIVLGSGIAGLSFALNVAKKGRVAIVTKKNRAESNTNYAQGGIAAVMAQDDSFELHVRDTLEAGAGLCHEDVVRTIVEEGPDRVNELIELGVRFSQREDKELDLGREGGHTRRRILHAKDVTGREIERALLHAVSENGNIRIFENHFAIDLITTHKLGLNSIPPAFIIRRRNRSLFPKQFEARAPFSRPSTSANSCMPITPWVHSPRATSWLAPLIAR